MLSPILSSKDTLASSKHGNWYPLWEIEFVFFRIDIALGHHFLIPLLISIN
jgi:hypothetical protein